MSRHCLTPSRKLGARGTILSTSNPTSSPAACRFLMLIWSCSANASAHTSSQAWHWKTRSKYCVQRKVAGDPGGHLESLLAYDVPTDATDVGFVKTSYTWFPV